MATSLAVRDFGLARPLTPLGQQLAQRLVDAHLVGAHHLAHRVGELSRERLDEAGEQPRVGMQRRVGGHAETERAQRELAALEAGIHMPRHREGELEEVRT